LKPTPEELASPSPFRMAKVNAIWQKAQVSLHEAKQKELFTLLRRHDLEELALKKLRNDGGDKEGLREAYTRQQLHDILRRYGLEHTSPLGKLDPSSSSRPHHPDSPSGRKVEHNVFKDGRLNKLWDKAEQAGFTQEQLGILHEEFSHHQEKVDMLDTLQEAEAPKEQREMLSNDILGKAEHPYAPENTLEKIKMTVKQGFKRLSQMASTGPEMSMEFDNTKVEALWRMATRGKFNNPELSSLKEELHHYAKRLEKLSYLEGQLHLEGMDPGEKHYSHPHLEDRIAKTGRQVEKLHAELEHRIFSRTEL